jgi:hypothetical protein
LPFLLYATPKGELGQSYLSFLICHVKGSVKSNIFVGQIPMTEKVKVLRKNQVYADIQKEFTYRTLYIDDA